ncbi:MAG: hypothetical protein ABWX67_17490 [Allosphingosinicella sp.]
MAKLIAAAVLLIGMETAGSACATLSEDGILDSVDVVVDGTALCGLNKGVCLLRAHKVIKDGLAGNKGSAVYRLRFEPGANRRFARAMEKEGYMLMCPPNWEPQRSRIQGRFYLNRVKGGYRVHSNSPWGLRSAKEDHE